MSSFCHLTQSYLTSLISMCHSMVKPVRPRKTLAMFHMFHSGTYNSESKHSTDAVSVPDVPSIPSEIVQWVAQVFAVGALGDAHVRATEEATEDSHSTSSGLAGANACLDWFGRSGFRIRHVLIVPCGLRLFLEAITWMRGCQSLSFDVTKRNPISFISS